MKDTPKPDNRRPYDAAFRTAALRLATQSHSTPATEQRAVGSPKTPNWERKRVKGFGFHTRRYVIR